MATESKVALVTGGSSGIGRATAAAFVAAGYRTAILDRDEAGGRAVEAELRAGGGEATFYACDVASDASVKAAVDAAVAAYGRLDAAFNGAGIDGEAGNLTHQCTLENWRRVLAVDLDGVFYSMRHEIPHMLASGGGAIVNCSSSAGILGAPTFAAYAAAKHGVSGLTKVAGLEYFKQGIRVNAVAPGMIRTPMTAGLDPTLLAGLLEVSPGGRLGEPEEIASTVVFLCSDAASYIAGQIVPVDAAWTAQ